MITTKNMFLLLCQFYVFRKMTRQKLKRIDVIEIPVSIIFSFAICYISKTFILLYPCLLLLAQTVYHHFRYYYSLRYNLPLNIIAFGVVICDMVISLLVSSPILFFLFYFFKGTALLDILQVFINGLIELLLVFLLFKIKRFNSGIEPNKDASYDVLLLGSLTCIFSMTIFSGNNIALDSTETLIIIVLFFCVCIGICATRYFSQRYQKAVYKRNVEILEHTQEQLIAKNEQLSKQNEILSSIIHRDNKIIPTMEIAVKNLCEQNDVNVPEEIISSLSALTLDRAKTIESYQQQETNLSKTKITTIDSVIEFLNYKSMQNDVVFDFSFQPEALKQIVLTFDNSIELNTIICDLGENSIIATKNQEKKYVKISFELSNDNFPQIVFFDSGNFFDPSILNFIGEKRITTHKNDGGSGIGMMTLFSIIKKYNASFCLNERMEQEFFTKSITIRFDSKANRFLLTHE